MSQPSQHHHHPPLAVVVAVAAVLALLPPRSSADPYDEVCLSSLQQSLSLRNWTKSSFSAPCDGLISKLDGITCNNGRVYKLSLPGMSLSGAIPPELSNCTNLQSLDLSSNSLSGAIPPELSKLLNLAVLNLSANALTGPIPRELASCAYLNVIDLHGNQLSGPIPDELGLLVRLSTFDVSYNRLSGPVPVLLANRSSTAAGGAGGGGAVAAGTAARFNASSFAGNKDLYGYPLAPMRGHGLSVLTIVGIGLGSGLLSLVLSFSAVCIWLRSTDRTATAPGEEGKISHVMPAY